MRFSDDKINADAANDQRRTQVGGSRRVFVFCEVHPRVRSVRRGRVGVGLCFAGVHPRLRSAPSGPSLSLVRYPPRFAQGINHRSFSWFGFTIRGPRWFLFVNSNASVVDGLPPVSSVAPKWGQRRAPARRDARKTNALFDPHNTKAPVVDGLPPIWSAATRWGAENASFTRERPAKFTNESRSFTTADAFSGGRARNARMDARKTQAHANATSPS